MTTMINEKLARLRTHRNNISRYRRLLKTHLTDIEQEFIERRLSQERLALESVAGSTFPIALESVRRLHAGLQSFLSMRRIEARRKNASAFRLRFSQSLASLRQRLSHAMVRSTIQRLGKTTNPLT